MVLHFLKSETTWGEDVVGYESEDSDESSEIDPYDFLLRLRSLTLPDMQPDIRQEIDALSTAMARRQEAIGQSWHNWQMLLLSDEFWDMTDAGVGRV